MKQFLTIATAMATCLVLAFGVSAQDRFDRSAVIPAQPDDIGGFGNVVAGVDFDGDGLLEIYTVNNDWHDVLGKDLKPRIYKYEKVAGGGWEIKWHTELPFDFQNTWPAMAAADLDNDGKWEIVWGPVNNFGGGLNPNPSRVVVFETPGDGSDNMGVDNGDGTWRPNAEYTITPDDNVNLRPFRWLINDIDGDGTDEIVASARVGDGIQIYSVDDVPDAADGSETWTTEFSGVTGVFYDLAIIDSTVYGLQSNGDVTPVTWSAAGDSFRVGNKQVGLVGNGSWKSSAVIDADGDGTKEIIVASWSSSTSNVYLLQQDGDSLTTTIIKDVPDASFRLYGGAAGDMDGDGNVDFAFGTRQSTPNAIIHRLEYQGGAVDDPTNWELSIIDQGVSPAQQYDVTVMADMDGDGEDELVYSGTPRGQGAADPPQPLVILDRIPGNQPIIQSVTDVPNDQGRQLRVTWKGAADDVGGTRFTANLSGDNEVPPLASVATGKATFVLSADHTALSYLLEVANVDSVTQTHIHIGSPDINGPVDVFLFGPVAGGGASNGVIASGVITEADLIGPNAGDMAGFVNELLVGNTYVNLHTTTNAPGEIRGQITTDLVSKAQPPQLNSAYKITKYSVWRVSDGAPPVELAQVDAIQLPMQSAVVPTLGDGEDWKATYVVFSHTAEPTVRWKSFPKSGISEDNLAPGAPTTVLASEEASDQGSFVQLTWDESPDADFAFFVVVRGTESGFDPATAEELGSTAENSFSDADVAANETFFYRVAAVDLNNNRGDFSQEVSLLVTSVDGGGPSIPKTFALEQNYPNPFNPETQIQYQLPKDSDVTLRIFNMMGQKVRTLVNETKQAGSYTIKWDGRNNSGQKVATGVYIYLIKAGSFTQSKRMTLIK